MNIYVNTFNKSNVHVCPLYQVSTSVM